MNALVRTTGLVEARPFFAPVSPDKLNDLFDQHEKMTASIRFISGVTKGEHGGAFHYFIEGNRQIDNTRYSSISAEKIFMEDGAMAALHAAYWQKAMNLTDVYSAMPENRRKQWSDEIQAMKTPAFERDVVVATLQELLSSRERFFSERIDGIFRALSGQHVTNQPQGFSKRMIINYAITYGSVSTHVAGYLHDLRIVIARFMGRDEPQYNARRAAMEAVWENTGVWHELDGGALKIRLYKKGTMHIEVHPDIAEKLNSILAFLHPTAIPPNFREKKTKKKVFTLLSRPIPFAVLELLLPEKRRGERGNTFTFGYGHNKLGAVYEEAVRIVKSLGGVETGKDTYTFDYQINDILSDLQLTGMLPDQKAHQYYPTPGHLATEAAAIADIGSQDQVLEPSAGQGALAFALPRERTTCVEISPLQVKILEAKGYNAICADFIDWAETAYSSQRFFDRVVMNPPFSDGRAKLHVQAASKLVKQGGSVTAILPASMKGKDILLGWKTTWSPIFVDEFEGCHANVVIMNSVK